MTALVVDASIVVKWFFPEVHSDAALRVVGSDHALVAPDLLGAEVANTFWKKSRRGEITDDEGRRLVADFRCLDIAMVPHEALLPMAFDLGAKAGHPVYDCLYLALAHRSDCWLVTADRRFYQTFAQGEWGRCMAWVDDF